MSYTVKKLAKLSGVSVRTLHFYDEIGLLKPAFVAENGYRYYEEDQLLGLQQILFFRELGFPLGEIQKILSSKTFDKIEALKSHKILLQQNVDKTHELIRTIDKTIRKLEGKGTMKDNEIYFGFDKAKQEGYEKELVDKFGKQAQTHIDESKKRMKGWKQEDFDRVMKEGGEALQRLVVLIEKGATPADADVQTLIAAHYKWVCHFWTPNRESYTGLGRLYVESPDFRKFYEPFHPDLANFLADAMKLFADASL